MDQNQKGYEEQNQAARILRFQTKNPILEISDFGLAEKLNMVPGKFYVYYKPTYANGFGQFEGQDIDLNYVQAYDQICRDEISPNFSFFENEFENVKNQLLTQDLAKSIFEKAFKRTYDVEFVFNTDINQLKSKIKNGEIGDKPIMLLTCKEQMIPYFI